MDNPKSYPIARIVRGLAATLCVLWSLVVFLPQKEVQSQDAYGVALAKLINSPSVSRVIAEDGDAKLVVKYIGTATSGGTITVASNGDITFATGAVGASVADTTLECPVSGALGGIIDVSDTACNTLGEVVDIINASTSWRAAIVDGLRSESSNDTLVALSETSANDKDGLMLYGDSSVAFTQDLALIPPEMRTIKTYLKTPQVGGTLIPNPWAGTRAMLFKAKATSTYASGTSTVSLVCVVPNNKTSGGIETVTTMWSEAGGASTAALTMDYSPYGFLGCKDGKLLLRVVNSAAMSANVTAVHGQLITLEPGP